MPIHHHISFKIASFPYKILNSKEPSYLANLHFRRPSGIGARPDPLYCILCRSHWHRGAARLQRACFCQWLTGLRARCAARSYSPSHTDVLVYRERQGLDEFQTTLSQPFEDEADMVGLQPSSAPLQQYRNEGVGRRPSTRWLCPRSGSSHRQWMTLARHVNPISGVCLFQLRQLRIIRRSLTTDAAHALVRALIHTRIDYCNGLLASCPRYLTDKLQVVLRVAARLVLQLPYRSSVTEAMHRQLHWLDVVDRVNYKIGLLVYKCLHGLAPGYLSNQCILALTFAGRANMRSSSRLDRLLYVPRTKTKTLGHEGSTTPRLPCGTRSRWTCVIPDSHSTPSEQNWNLTFS